MLYTDEAPHLPPRISMGVKGLWAFLRHITSVVALPLDPLVATDSPPLDPDSHADESDPDQPHVFLPDIPIQRFCLLLDWLTERGASVKAANAASLHLEDAGLHRATYERACRQALVARLTHAEAKSHIEAQYLAEPVRRAELRKEHYGPKAHTVVAQDHPTNRHGLKHYTWIARQRATIGWEVKRRLKEARKQKHAHRYRPHGADASRTPARPSAPTKPWNPRENPIPVPVVSPVSPTAYPHLSSPTNCLFALQTPSAPSAVHWMVSPHEADPLVARLARQAAQGTFLSPDGERYSAEHIHQYAVDGDVMTTASSQESRFFIRHISDDRVAVLDRRALEEAELVAPDGSRKQLWPFKRVWAQINAAIVAGTDYGAGIFGIGYRTIVQSSRWLEFCNRDWLGESKALARGSLAWQRLAGEFADTLRAAAFPKGMTSKHDLPSNMSDPSFDLRTLTHAQHRRITFDDLSFERFITTAKVMRGDDIPPSELCSTDAWFAAEVKRRLSLRESGGDIIYTFRKPKKTSTTDVAVPIEVDVDVEIHKDVLPAEGAASHGGPAPRADSDIDMQESETPAAQPEGLPSSRPFTSKLRRLLRIPFQFNHRQIDLGPQSRLLDGTLEEARRALAGVNGNVEQVRSPRVSPHAPATAAELCAFGRVRALLKGINFSADQDDGGELGDDHDNDGRSDGEQGAPSKAKKASPKAQRPLRGKPKPEAADTTLDTSSPTNDGPPLPLPKKVKSFKHYAQKKTVRVPRRPAVRSLAAVSPDPPLPADSPRPEPPGRILDAYLDVVHDVVARRFDLLLPVVHTVLQHAAEVSGSSAYLCALTDVASRFDAWSSLASDVARIMHFLEDPPRRADARPRRQAAVAHKYFGSPGATESQALRDRLLLIDLQTGSPGGRIPAPFSSAYLAREAVCRQYISTLSISEVAFCLTPPRPLPTSPNRPISSVLFKAVKEGIFDAGFRMRRLPATIFLSNAAELGASWCTARYQNSVRVLGPAASGFVRDLFAGEETVLSNLARFGPPASSTLPLLVAADPVDLAKGQGDAPRAQALRDRLSSLAIELVLSKPFRAGPSTTADAADAAWRSDAEDRLAAAFSAAPAARAKKQKKKKIRTDPSATPPIAPATVQSFVSAFARFAEAIQRVVRTAVVEDPTSASPLEPLSSWPSAKGDHGNIVQLVRGMLVVEQALGRDFAPNYACTALRLDSKCLQAILQPVNSEMILAEWVSGANTTIDLVNKALLASGKAGTPLAPCLPTNPFHYARKSRPHETAKTKSDAIRRELAALGIATDLVLLEGIHTAKFARTVVPSDPSTVQLDRVPHIELDSSRKARLDSFFAVLRAADLVGVVRAPAICFDLLFELPKPGILLSAGFATVSASHISFLMLDPTLVLAATPTRLGTDGQPRDSVSLVNASLADASLSSRWCDGAVARRILRAVALRGLAVLCAGDSASAPCAASPLADPLESGPPDGGRAHPAAAQCTLSERLSFVSTDAAVEWRRPAPVARDTPPGKASPESGRVRPRLSAREVAVVKSVNFRQVGLSLNDADRRCALQDSLRGAPRSDAAPCSQTGTSSDDDSGAGRLDALAGADLSDPMQVEPSESVDPGNTIAGRLALDGLADDVLLAGADVGERELIEVTFYDRENNTLHSVGFKSSELRRLDVYSADEQEAAGPYAVDGIAKLVADQPDSPLALHLLAQLATRNPLRRDIVFQHQLRRDATIQSVCDRMRDYVLDKLVPPDSTKPIPRLVLFVGNELKIRSKAASGASRGEAFSDEFITALQARPDRLKVEVYRVNEYLTSQTCPNVACRLARANRCNLYRDRELIAHPNFLSTGDPIYRLIECAHCDLVFHRDVLGSTNIMRVGIFALAMPVAGDRIVHIFDDRVEEAVGLTSRSQTAKNDGKPRPARDDALATPTASGTSPLGGGPSATALDVVDSASTAQAASAQAAAADAATPPLSKAVKSPVVPTRLPALDMQPRPTPPLLLPTFVRPLLPIFVFRGSNEVASAGTRSRQSHAPSVPLQRRFALDHTHQEPPPRRSPPAASGRPPFVSVPSSQPLVRAVDRMLAASVAAELRKAFHDLGRSSPYGPLDLLRVQGLLYDAIPLDIGHQQDAHEVLAGLFRELAREGFATDVGISPSQVGLTFEIESTCTCGAVTTRRPPKDLFWTVHLARKVDSGQNRSYHASLEDALRASCVGEEVKRCDTCKINTGASVDDFEGLELDGVEPGVGTRHSTRMRVLDARRVLLVHLNVDAVLPARNAVGIPASAPLDLPDIRNLAIPAQFALGEVVNSDDLPVVFYKLSAILVRESLSTASGHYWVKGTSSSSLAASGFDAAFPACVRFDDERVELASVHDPSDPGVPYILAYELDEAWAHSLDVAQSEDALLLAATDYPLPAARSLIGPYLDPSSDLAAPSLCPLLAARFISCVELYSFNSSAFFQGSPDFARAVAKQEHLSPRLVAEVRNLG
ncbi:hypothetical protein OF846_003104 [Rhodotorula toruloides]|nr:hypothetical protein OF846_003104 [Rhodotorula toruloides]